MSINFPKYAKIKNNYCICYHGAKPDHLFQLLITLPQIEKEFPNLNIFISCLDRLEYLSDGYDKIILKSNLEKHRENFAHIRQIYDNPRCNSIYDLLKESGIPFPQKPTPIKTTPLCLICPDGAFHQMTVSEIQHYKSLAQSQGYKCYVIASDFNSTRLDFDMKLVGKEKIEWTDQAGWVIGVENEYIYLSGMQGARTTLIDKGSDIRFYAELFPAQSIISQ